MTLIKAYERLAVVLSDGLAQGIVYDFLCDVRQVLWVEQDLLIIGKLTLSLI